MVLMQAVDSSYRIVCQALPCRRGAQEGVFYPLRFVALTLRPILVQLCHPCRISFPVGQL
jgi:hypothetical protein